MRLALRLISGAIFSVAPMRLKHWWFRNVVMPRVMRDMRREMIERIETDPAAR